MLYKEKRESQQDVSKAKASDAGKRKEETIYIH